MGKKLELKITCTTQCNSAANFYSLTSSYAPFKYMYMYLSHIRSCTYFVLDNSIVSTPGWNRLGCGHDRVTVQLAVSTRSEGTEGPPLADS